MEIPRVIKNFLNAPLEKIVSKDAKPIDKIISGIAIATFSLFSLGAYGVYVYKFLEKHKAENLTVKLKQLIDHDNHKEVEKLLKKHSMLKKASLGPIISKAIEKKHWEMLKVLVENGINVDEYKSNHETPLYQVIDSTDINYDVALFLVGNGANLNLSLESYNYSPLALALLSWEDSSEKDKAEELIQLMISKRAELKENKLQLSRSLIATLNSYNWPNEEQKNRFRQTLEIKT